MTAVSSRELQPTVVEELTTDSDLPEGWTRVRLPQVCEINPPKPSTDSLPPDAPVTFVPMPAVDAELGAISKPETQPFSEVRKGYTAFRDGDVIMAKITPCMENGKAAIARDLQNSLGFGSTEFHVLRPTDAVIAEFVYHFIRQGSFRKAAEAEMTGSVGQKRVPAGFLEQAEIPLPPLSEQKRIVTKVESLLARVNAARERLARVPTILKRFRQAVLAAACSGRLTEEWRNSKCLPQTGHALLQDRYEQNQQQKETKQSGKGRKALIRPEINDADPLSATWTWASVDQICSMIVDCPHSTPKWSDRGEVCLRTTNFRPGFLDLSEVRYVSPKVYEQRIARLEPQPEDVVYSREGGILGIACIVPPGAKVCLGQRMMLMRTDREVYLPNLLMHVLNSPLILSRVQELTGGTASPHLNVGDIKAFPIPLPPLPEQHKIVRRVEALFKLADTIEKRVAMATARAEKLTQAVLAKAFRSELVPTEAEMARREGRDYEPAAALLARIQAEWMTREGEETTRRRPTMNRQAYSTKPGKLGSRNIGK